MWLARVRDTCARARRAGFAFFPRSNGASCLNPYYDHYVMTTQLLVSGLSGLGGVLEPGSPAAVAQLTCILGVQVT